MNGDRFRGKAREGLSIAKVRTHNVRKTVATLIDDEGLSARVGADRLGLPVCP
jgi:integrase